MTHQYRVLGREEESDALRELGNVAFSHAATALSMLVGRRVDISMPNVHVLTAREVESVMAEEPVYTITLRLLGERQGILALIFPQADAVALAAMLEGASPEGREALTPEQENVLAEVANIMSGSALLAMYRFLKISLLHGTPMIRLRTRDSREREQARLSWRNDLSIVVEAEFSVEGRTAATGTMVISLTDLEFFLDALKQVGG